MELIGAGFPIVGYLILIAGCFCVVYLTRKLLIPAWRIRTSFGYRLLIRALVLTFVAVAGTLVFANAMFGYFVAIDSTADAVTLRYCWPRPCISLPRATVTFNMVPVGKGARAVVLVKVGSTTYRSNEVKTKIAEDVIAYVSSR